MKHEKSYHPRQQQQQQEKKSYVFFLFSTTIRNDVTTRQPKLLQLLLLLLRVTVSVRGILTMVGICPGRTDWAAGPMPICSMSAFLSARWLRPLISSWSLRCCGGWKYLHGGFSRLHRPCEHKQKQTQKKRRIKYRNCTRRRPLNQPTNANLIPWGKVRANNNEQRAVIISHWRGKEDEKEARKEEEREWHHRHTQ